jgi:outer membrane protein assembly factor BamE (lipoprotein component of BamABCDE complex)
MRINMVGKTALLIVIGVLVCFCNAANESTNSTIVAAEKPKEANNAAQSNVKQDVNSQQNLVKQKKTAAQSRWRKIQKDMSEIKVREILGEPLLTQACSGKSVWFYQSLPDSADNLEIAGTVVFFVQPYDPSTIMARENSRYITDLRNMLRSAQARIASYSSQNGYPYVGSSQNLTGKETEHVDDETISKLSHDPGNFVLPYQTRNSDPARKADAEILTNQFKRNFAVSLQKINATHDQKVKILTADIQPRSIEFLVQTVNVPDWDDEKWLIEKPKPLRITAGKRWEKPFNWRKLKINMTQDEVESTLGPPTDSTSGIEGTVFNYGGTLEIGTITFALKKTDKRISAWQEPFWPLVQTRLANTSEKSSDLKDKTILEDSNKSLAQRKN